MATSYASLDEYRADTGDTASDGARVTNMLGQQSAKLRAELGIADGCALSDDALALARALVVDAVRKALAPSAISGLGEVADNATQASWTANGFSASATFSNPSGSAYWDRATLGALKRLLGKGQRVRMVQQSFGSLS